AVIDSDEFGEAVREQERLFTQAGISSVPSVIVNDRYLIQGGQPPEIFEQSLREIAAEAG
ncbi:MAG: DsbA family protein, partial [Piscinibacter sp.]|uniref:DsbA family oxidoreductase n=1 Tax=Piscinibacter sp. TaxID=1903157 RepID=UPI003D0D92DC